MSTACSVVTIGVMKLIYWSVRKLFVWLGRRRMDHDAVRKLRIWEAAQSERRLADLETVSEEICLSFLLYCIQAQLIQTL